MGPDEVQAWIQVAQVLAAVGVNVVNSIKGMIHHAQPSLTQEQIDAAYTEILKDDDLRIAFAKLAASSDPV